MKFNDELCEYQKIQLIDSNNSNEITKVSDNNKEIQFIDLNISNEITKLHDKDIIYYKIIYKKSILEETLEYYLNDTTNKEWFKLGKLKDIVFTQHNDFENTTYFTFENSKNKYNRSEFYIKKNLNIPL